MIGSYVPRPEWLMLDWHHACLEAEMLTIQRCASCATWRHPPRRFCAACRSRESAFVPVSGAGTVRSYAVSHRSMDPGWHEATPYATLVVALDEQVSLLAATTSTPNDLAPGMPVQCSIERRSDDFVLVWAEPSDETPDIRPAASGR